MRQRVLNMLIALDSLVLVWVTLGKSHPSETISSAAYRSELQGQFFGRTRPFIDWLLSGLEPDHCKGAYDHAVAKGNLPEDMRG
ncbi:MAG: hypothetical protein V4858_09085 [Pseudomonadota bacterium]